MKPVQPDEALSAIVGSMPRSRGGLIRKLWDYSKENKLPDGKKRTNINAGAALAVMTARRFLAVSMQWKENPLPRHPSG